MAGFAESGSPHLKGEMGGGFVATARFLHFGRDDKEISKDLGILTDSGLRRSSALPLSEFERISLT
jgi:hypothetical protein